MQELLDPVERGPGRMAGFVHELDGQNRVGPGRDPVRIAG